MEELDLKSLFEYYVGYIWYILLTVALITSLSVLYSTVIKKPMYSSYTTLVLAGSDNTDNSGITQGEVTLNQKLVSTYREIIKSRKVISQVVSNLNLDNSIEYVQAHTSVATEKDTELIRITVTHQNANTAKNIVDEIANVFSKEIVKIYNIKNVAVIDVGEVSSKPYNINLVKEGIIAAIAGVIISCGIIFALYYFDTTVKSPDEIESKLGLPILGSVQDIRSLKESNR